MPKFHLVLLIHSHQPVGNFDGVFEQTYQRSYLPFVQHLARHPAVRVGLHYTGPLLEWFEQRHAEFLDTLHELVARGQVEMVGGGFYEPILISIPPEDQAEQLSRMSGYLQKRFGAAPAGAWLAERVWEPQLPYALSLSNIRYTLVDDVHFAAAGFEPGQLYGDYICEDRARTVRVFPGLKALRYLLPFRSVEEGMGYLRECAEAHPGGMAAMGDDCEKFGAWPDTYDHCYAQGGWVERFFAAVEAADDWLTATPPGEWVASHPPLGRADLPTASYTEMMEWALPTVARREFQAVSHEFASRSDVLKFLRGGHWRGFFTKYPESNLLHQKMLRVSGQLRGLAAGRLGKGQRTKLADARTRVLRAQCNDAYWHGVFGGLYAPHLRTELWRELVRAEALAEEIAAPESSALRVERCDFDADGAEELYVTSTRLAALLRPSDGGTLGAIDFRTSGVTLINSMQRRLETYHSRLSETSSVRQGHVASIHEQVRVKEPGLERFLRYDRWPRSSFRLLLFRPQKTFEDYCELRLDEHALLAGGAYAIGDDSPQRISMELHAPLAAKHSGADGLEELRCAKRFSFAHAHEGTGYRVDCASELSLSGASAFRGQVGIEVILNFLAPDQPDRFFEVAGSRHPLRWTAALPFSEVPSGRLRLVDEWQNVAATIEAPSAAQFWIAPIESVSESEEGFERVYQGSQILMVWPVELAAGASWRGEVSLRIEPARG